MHTNDLLVLLIAAASIFLSFQTTGSMVLKPAWSFTLEADGAGIEGSREAPLPVPAPVVADLDDDGRPEVLVCTQDGRLLVLDPEPPSRLPASRPTKWRQLPVRAAADRWHRPVNLSTGVLLLLPCAHAPAPPCARPPARSRARPSPPFGSPAARATRRCVRRRAYARMWASQRAGGRWRWRLACCARCIRPSAGCRWSSCSPKTGASSPSTTSCGRCGSTRWARAARRRRSCHQQLWARPSPPAVHAVRARARARARAGVRAGQLVLGLRLGLVVRVRASRG